MAIIFWVYINSIVLVGSCILLSLLFSEVVYRDNYARYKRELTQKETADGVGAESAMFQIGVDSIIDDINGRIKKQGVATLEAATNVCSTLYADPRNKEICATRLKRVSMPKDGFVSKETYPVLSKIDLSQGKTEDVMYSSYLASKEIGFKISVFNHFSAPYLFISIFLLLGLSASSVGNLVIDAIYKKQFGERAPGGTPLVSLLLGPVVSCIMGACLVYIFTPSGEEHQYFAKKLLNTPIAVFIASFMFSFSPVNTIQNIASFVFLQLKSLVGESRGGQKEKSAVQES